MKKVLSLLLSLAMLLSITSGLNLTAYAEVQTGKCGENVNYSLDTETGVLTISGTGDMKHYGNEWDGKYNLSPFYSNNKIKSIVIETSVTSIGNYAFSYCKSLTSVTIPDSVTSIGSCAFYNCKSLTSVTIGNSVTSIGDGAFDSCTSLTDVTIGESVTSIGNYAFDSCTSLTSVTIPNSVTSIGNGAFDSCTSLTDVTIGESVTSIGNYAFRGCKSLTSVTIPDSVTSIGNNAFRGCTSLTSVTIPDSVTSIGDYTFDDCTKLMDVYYNGTKEQWKSIKVGSNNSYLTRANIICTDGVIFNGGTAVIDSLRYKLNSDNTASVIGYEGNPTNVNIPETISYANETLSVTSIGKSAFSYCESLTSVTIGNGVTSIGNYAFYYCTSLTSVTIPKSVTSIGDQAFYYCYFTKSNFINNSGLRVSTNIVDSDDNGFCIKDSKLVIMRPAFVTDEVVIPDGVKYIGGSAFTDCQSITKIKIPKTVERISYFEANLGPIFYDFSPFSRCKNLNDINVDSSNTNFSSQDGVLFNKDKTELIQYPIGNARTSYSIPNSVTSIGNAAFNSCTNLTNVTLPDSITSISSAAFSQCTSLTSMIIPNGVTSISGAAFYDCESLTSVTIPDSVTEIYSEAFCGCTSLINLEIPNSVTSIGELAFYSCSSLTDVYYSGTKAQWESIKIFRDNGSATIHCTDGSIFNGGTVVIDGLGYQLNSDNTADVIGYKGNPTNINIPETISYANETLSVTSIGEEAFRWCESLTSVTIPDSVTSIGKQAFSSCSSLTSVTIPDSVTSIGDYALYYCTSLTSVTIPNSVTSIGDYALYYCTRLTSVTIPNSVTSIGYGAFKDCTRLTSVTIPNSVTSIGYGAFEDCKSLNDVYYNGTKERWKLISVGSNNSDLMRANIHCTDGGIFNGGTAVIDGLKYQLNSDNTAVVIGPEGNPANVNIPDTISYANETLSVTSIGEDAFRWCESLTSITIPDSVTSIGKYAFQGCKSLTSVTIPDSVTSIGDYALYYCTSLTSVTIPNSVTSIGNYAFSGCKSLASITIPNSVTSIGSYAFYSCSIKDVYYTGTQSQWSKIAIQSGNDSLDSATIHYNFAPCKGDNHNSFGEWKVIKNATCTESGLKQRICSNDGYVEEKTIPATGHTEKLINEKSATCTSTGYTGDKVCSVCNEVLEKGQEIPMTEHICEATSVEPTCTEQGHTLYKCVNCDYSYKVYDGEPATGHKEITDEAVESTCTKTGLTEGSHCAVCKEVIVEQEVIPAKGHTIETVPGKAATCTENGLTDGKKCSVCGEVLEAQVEIPALGHTVKFINKKDATYTENGYTGDKVCSVCNEVLEVGHETEKLLPTTQPTTTTQPSTSETTTTTTVTPTESTTSVTTQSTTEAPATQPATVPATTAAPVASTTQATTVATTQATTQATTAATTTAVAVPTTAQTVVTTTQKPTTTKAPEKINKKQKKANIKKATPAKASATISWAKVKGVKGYEVQLATDKKFKKNVKSKTINKQKTTKTTVKNLKSKTKYYVRIRTYKVSKGTKVYSTWSKTKTVKTK